MIDWPNLFANALWILALAAALAVVSTAWWRASLENTRLRNALGRRNNHLALLGCLVLLGIGLALAVPSTIEKLAWSALTVLAIVQFGLAVREIRRKDARIQKK
ncbi:MAG TPA: hypothetical protein VMN57_12305 [Anaerolineales bacterium]|nr:hypothetical protein [Anaerolineales bacterium]